MSYKILKNNEIIDISKTIRYVYYVPRLNLFWGCDDSPELREGILTDNNIVYHVKGLKNFPKEIFCDTVTVEEISDAEYNKLKAFNGQTPEEIIDNYTMYLIEEGLL